MYQCPECPAAAFCSHAVETRPATVSPEALAALETRLAECEKRLENFRKEYDVDKHQVDWGINCIIGMMNVGTEMDNKLLERITALEQAASARTSSKPRRPAPRPAPRPRGKARSRTASSNAKPSSGRSGRLPRRRA